MDYAEAVKKVRTEKPKDNFIVLEFGYDNKVLLPHKDGVAVLSALVNAERLSDKYGSPTRITELERNNFSSRSMSYQEYERIKVAALLNLTPDEVKEMMEAANKPTSSTS